MLAPAVPATSTAHPDAGTRWYRLPGLAVVGFLVAVSFALGAVTGVVGPLIWATALGILVAPVVRSRRCTEPGVVAARTTVLRVGVALLGLRVSLGDLASVGLAGMVVVLGTIVLTMVITTWLGRRLGLPSGLSLLIATGTAICGASAIAAMNTVTRASSAAVGYAIAMVTVFGTLAMLAIPALAAAIGLSSHEAGLWAGASIHEVAQATGAGGMISQDALDVATLVKLSRVVMLGPLIVLVAILNRSREGTAARVPTFVIVFVALMVVSSLVPFPTVLIDAGTTLSGVLLAAGLAALGLGIAPSALRAAGATPLILGLGASAVAIVTSLGLIALTT